MFNACMGCGAYGIETAVDPAGPFAVCPARGHRHRLVRPPLFVLTGASGAGKTAVAPRVAAALLECVVLESDIRWRREFDAPADGYRAYRDLWLRLAKNIRQAGRPVVLCGSAVLEQFEPCPGRRYFTLLHHLALVCNKAVLTARLSGRSARRESSGDGVVAQMDRFNAWLRENADTSDPPMTLLDTTVAPIESTVAATVA